MRKFAAGFAVLVIATIFPLSMARADDASSTPLPTAATAPAMPNTTENQQPGEERHRVDVEHGFEANQITIVLAAIIVAGGLAIGIGRRRRQL
ncbi:MAG: hypothetical protein WCO08_01410 [Actinomycetes bacterium]